MNWDSGRIKKNHQHQKYVNNRENIVYVYIKKDESGKCNQRKMWMKLLIQCGIYFYALDRKRKTNENHREMDEPFFM